MAAVVAVAAAGQNSEGGELFARRFDNAVNCLENWAATL